MSYPGHSLGGGSYPSAAVQSVYSTSPADWAIHNWNNNIHNKLFLIKPEENRNQLPERNKLLYLNILYLNKLLYLNWHIVHTKLMQAFIKGNNHKAKVILPQGHIEHDMRIIFTLKVINGIRQDHLNTVIYQLAYTDQLLWKLLAILVPKGITDFALCVIVLVLHSQTFSHRMHRFSSH